MMYESTNFDTHKIVKSFVNAGISEGQAEVIVTAIMHSKDYDLSNLATKEQLSSTKYELKKDIEQLRLEMGHLRQELKQDVEQLRLEMGHLRQELKQDVEQLRLEMGHLRQELKQDIEQLRIEFNQKLDARISALEASMVKWLVGTMIGMTGVIIAAIKFIS